MKTTLSNIEKRSKLLFFIACLIFCARLNVFAQDKIISSKELIKNAKLYDGKLVFYQGEVIGEAMSRGNFVWINVHDGEAALGVWVAKDLASTLSYFGSYKYQGDWVVVSGIFNRNCPQHDGDLDIHAFDLKKIKEGKLILEKNFQPKLKLARFGAVAIIFLLLFKIIRRFKKRKVKISAHT